MKWILVLIMCVIPSMAIASDYYTDREGNMIEVDTTTTCVVFEKSTQPVMYNGQFQGMVERTTTSQDTMEKLQEIVDRIGN